VQLLAPTPELWTLVLRHRTQILYIVDIAMVVTYLDLRPGCLVLESGTGSASLTHSLARAVAPTGRVRSFEFHELRAKEAAAELLRNGLPPTLASVVMRNIEEKGFPVDELEGTADGVFLDLPGPWKVVQSAAQCLKPNGRFCSFSPCIEQVRTDEWKGRERRTGLGPNG
jgi:tRNA (adenine57-N1/adenine58-N1)-methyltransferase